MCALLNNALNPLYDFIRQYGENCVTLDCFSKFSRLYFALVGEVEISLMEYIDSSEVLFPPNQSISHKTVELILNNSFSPKAFVNQEYQILETIEMKHLFLNKSQGKKLGYKIIQNTPEKLYPYFKRYINGALPASICEAIEDIIQALPPNILRDVSRMDRNICFVLVRKNPELFLCPDIWQQSKDFQQGIVCAINHYMQPEQLQKLIVIILQIDTENIAEDLYRVFGEKLFPALYSALHLVNLPFERLNYWTPVLLKNQSLLIKEILNLPKEKWRRSLFLKLDMNVNGFAQSVKQSDWLKLYYELFKEKLAGADKTAVAIQFFPAVFCTNYHFDDGFIQDIVGTVYQEVKANTVSSDSWSRFQHILPQVEDYQAWDRCLRIRRALEAKGYQTSLMES